MYGMLYLLFHYSRFTQLRVFRFIAGLFNVTGPAVVSLMRQQAIAYGASFEADVVVGVDASERPLKVRTNSSLIETHSIIVATGAESNWLNVKGEYEMRGGGVSSCATCDGHIYRGKRVLVVGGGDTAMEDALVLARTSEVRVALISFYRLVFISRLHSHICLDLLVCHCDSSKRYFPRVEGLSSASFGTSFNIYQVEHSCFGNYW